MFLPRFLILAAAVGLLGGCFKGPGFLGQKQAAQLVHGEAGEVVAPSVESAGGVVTATVSSSSKATQLVTASTSSAIAGTQLAIPPGALSLDTEITVEEGSSIASASIATELGLDSVSEIAAASPAVVISASVSMDTSVPFSLSLPLSGTSLALDDPYAKLIVIYRAQKAADGTVVSGLFPRSELTIKNGLVKVLTRFFGSYQAAYSDVVVAEKKEVLTTAKILTKVEETVLPSANISAPAAVHDSHARTTQFTAALSGQGVTVGKCSVVVDTDKTSPWDLAAISESGLDYTAAPLGDTEMTIYARFQCVDNHGRTLTSDWSDAVPVAALPVSPASPTAANVSLTFNEDAEADVNLSYTHSESAAATGCSTSNVSSNLSIVTACACSSGLCKVRVKGSLNYYGAASFDYAVSTGDLTSNAANASLKVSGVNDAPIMLSGSNLALNQGQPATIYSANINMSDIDNALSSLVITVNSVPAHGALKLSGTTLGVGSQVSQSALASGSFAYYHDNSANFSDSFSYSVSDGAAGYSSSLSISIKQTSWVFTDANNSLSGFGGGVPYNTTWNASNTTLEMLSLTPSDRQLYVPDTYADTSQIKILLHMNGTGPITNGQTMVNNTGSGLNLTASSPDSSSMTHDSAGKIFEALQLDGIDDFIQSSDIITGSSYTLMAWVKLPNPTRNPSQTIGGFSDGINKMFLTVKYGTGELVASCNSAAEVPSGRNLMANTWYHVGLTVSGITIKVFLNGRLVKIDGSGTTCGAAYDPGNAFYIGRADSGSYFYGSIDEVVAYNRALLDDELRSIHARQQGNYNWPTSWYASRIFDAGQVVDWTSLGWTPGRPYSKQIPDNGATESKYFTGNYNLPAVQGLWHFNANVNDSSGNGNGGTPYGSPVFSSPWDGKFAEALVLNGTSQYVAMPTSTAFNFGPADTGSFTISLWAQGMNVCPGGGSYLFRRIDVSDPDEQIYLACYDYIGVQKVKLQVVDYLGNQALVEAPVVLLGKSHHIVASKSGNVVKLYIDGLEVANQTAAFGSDPLDSNQPMTIGGYSGGGYFNGKIDEFAIWNVALTPAQISDLYERGSQHILFQVRSCDDQFCAGELFTGVDGTTGSFYADMMNPSTGLPEFSIITLPNNRYFQYIAIFKTDLLNNGPKLANVSIGAVAP